MSADKNQRLILAANEREKREFCGTFARTGTDHRSARPEQIETGIAIQPKTKSQIPRVVTSAFLL
jgi:hypothetical protein